jgi:glutathione S-transferase
MPSAPSITLHDFELSANCYKVRLLLAFLKIDYTRVAVNVFPGFEHRKPPFRELNPLGQVPVLIDGDRVLRDSQAILTYLASTYDKSGRWLPGESGILGQVMMWLFFAASELPASTTTRLHNMLGFPADEAVVRKSARSAFRIMDDHMTRREHEGAAWFASGNATLADLALFPSIALSRDFGVEHDEYPALRRWMRRLRSMDGFIVMPGIPAFY